MSEAYKLADGSLSTDYKAGDEFIVAEEEYYVNAGDIVELIEDDGTECPWFYTPKTSDESPVSWGALKPRKRKPFTKSDLKDGMRVELRDGTTHYVCGRYAYCLEDDSKVGVDHYNDLLFNEGWGGRDFDIIRVTDRDGTVLFEREPEKVKLELEVTPDQAEAIRKQLGQ